MAAEDDQIRLNLIIQGKDEAKKLADQLAGVRARQDELNTTFARGYITAGQYARSKKELAAEARTLERDLKSTARAVENLEAKQAGASKGFAGMGQTIQSTGRIIQDFTAAGLNGIINNLEQLGMGLAKQMGRSAAFGAAVGGAMQLAGVAAQIALPYIARFVEWLSPERVDPFRSKVEQTTDRIEKLREQVKASNAEPLKLAVARDELKQAEADLKRLTDAQEAYNQAKTGKTKNQRESEARIAEAVRNPETLAALQAQESAKLLATDPQFIAASEQLARMQADHDARSKVPVGMGGGNSAQQTQALKDQYATVKALRDTLSDRAGLAAGALMTGDPARLAEALDNAGLGGKASTVRANTPEMIGRQIEAAGEYERTLKEVEQTRQHIQGPGRKEAEAILSADAKPGRSEFVGPGRKEAKDVMTEYQSDAARAAADAKRKAVREVSEIVKANRAEATPQIDALMAEGRQQGLSDEETDRFVKMRYESMLQSRGVSKGNLFNLRNAASQAVQERRDGFNAVNGEKTLKENTDATKKLTQKLEDGVYVKMSN